MEGYDGYFSPFSKRKKGLTIVQCKMPKLELEGFFFLNSLSIYRYFHFLSPTYIELTHFCWFPGILLINNTYGCCVGSKEILCLGVFNTFKPRFKLCFSLAILSVRKSYKTVVLNQVE